MVACHDFPIVDFPLIDIPQKNGREERWNVTTRKASVESHTRPEKTGEHARDTHAHVSSNARRRTSFMLTFDN
jgi:hypothetical protein